MGLLADLMASPQSESANKLYNDRVDQWADFSPEHNDKYGHGKRIPYIGWFWRTTDFIGKSIAIGNAGGYIGVMENNKWGYPERMMTEAEADTFIGYLDRAFDAANKDVDPGEIFDELHAWFQTLRM